MTLKLCFASAVLILMSVQAIAADTPQARQCRSFLDQSFSTLDGRQAIEPCRIAVDEQPQDDVLMFSLGRGYDRAGEYENAYRWYSKAAGYGNAGAMNNIGWMYHQGNGFPVDLAQAASWYRKAADKGDEYALANLRALKDSGVDVDSAGKTHGAETAQSPGGGAAEGPPLNAPGHEREAEMISKGGTFTFTDETYLFTGGVAYALLSECRPSASAEDRVEAATFAQAAAQRAMIGNQYSNPDLGKTMGSQAHGQAFFAAGLAAANATKCEGAGILVANIAAIVRSNKQGQDGEEAAFIATCTPVHDNARCECLARTGSAVHPNIYQMEYSRQLVHSILKGNPFLGIQIMTQCGIMNY